jgi:histidinol phosphatase-like enzyme (inositol monophosphatase family)
VSQPSSWLEPVAEAARVAGEVALRHFRTGLTVEWKGDGSPVTAADREAERAVRAWIERRFPGDAVLGEELGFSGDESARRWLVDPIDGTKSFVAGVPLWGALVAVLERHEVVAGAIHCAAAGELVVAAPGAGCWWNGSRARVSDVTELPQAAVLTTDERFLDRPDRRARWGYLAERARLSRTWGDCFGYVLVATGRAEVMVDDRMNPWDAAPLLPIITEAGGVFTDWRGQRTAFGGDTIATNAALAVPVRGILLQEALA